MKEGSSFSTDALKSNPIVVIYVDSTVVLSEYPYIIKIFIKKASIVDISLRLFNSFYVNFTLNLLK